MNEIQPAGDGGEVLRKINTKTAQDVIRRMMGELSENTRTAYADDLKDFAKFLGVEDFAAILGRLAPLNALDGNNLVGEYLDDIDKVRNLSTSTWNRRLASINQLLKIGRVLGLINWQLEIKGKKIRAYRDTRGPTLEDLKKMLVTAAAHSNKEKAARDLAILRICFAAGLRKAEAYKADISVFDLDQGILHIIGAKDRAKDEDDMMKIPTKALAAIKAWVTVRGAQPGPLFPSLHRGHANKAMTGQGFWWIIDDISTRAGVGHVRPHGLRHSTATLALEAGATKDETQDHMRHKSAEVTKQYDDNRKRLKGRVADLLDDLL